MEAKIKNVRVFDISVHVKDLQVVKINAEPSNVACLMTCVVLARKLHQSINQLENAPDRSAPVKAGFTRQMRRPAEVARCTTSTERHRMVRLDGASTRAEQLADHCVEKARRLDRLQCPKSEGTLLPLFQTTAAPAAKFQAASALVTSTRVDHMLKKPCLLLVQPKIT